MKAFIFSLTMRTPLSAPMTLPTASAMMSETGTPSQSGVSCTPMPMPAEQKMMPTAIAERAATDSTERSMWPAMITRARPIDMTPRTEEASMMLAKMPGWK